LYLKIENMVVAIEGYIRNATGQPLVRISVKAFRRRGLHSNLALITDSESTDAKGYFKIIPRRKDLDAINSNVYIVVVDKQKKFVSVRDKHGKYKREEFYDRVEWRSQIICNLNNVIEIIVIQDPIPVTSEYDTVVIGSGFGGTIISLAIAKQYKERKEMKRVCILERGQWWISHEIHDSDPFRSFLIEKNMPFSTYSYPNDIKGMLTAIGNSRKINKVQGLYDFKKLRNVNIISGSGIGGGSLVYFNVTERPEKVVYQNWPTEHESNTGRTYFKYLGSIRNWEG
jgi:hypothetical protein